MYKVSPSLIGMLLECPRCLWLHYREKIERPRGIFPSLPSGMDEVFKNYFDIYRLKNELPPELVGKITDAKLYNEDMDKFNVWRNINFGRGGFKAEFPEYNMLLRGAVDEILVSQRGEFIPFDFKTRGYPTKEDTHEHYQHQLDLYALLFENNGFKSATTGYLLFFWPQEYEDGIVRFESELKKIDVSPERGLEILEETYKIISASKPKAHENCEYCRWVDGVHEIL
ncbi:MAG: hypothetical protein G01um10142_382 [Parcubacteria group bacterium Gr01-1014_2]|nr:MAG: hypothetical protein G01um10142_382 [Parcubacteria group bacterium Gr01-1014_2]